jgi:hypothetical protein
MHRTLSAAEIASTRHSQGGCEPTTELAFAPIANGPASIESARDAGAVIPELVRLAA